MSHIILDSSFHNFINISTFSQASMPKNFTTRHNTSRSSPICKWQLFIGQKKLRTFTNMSKEHLFSNVCERDRPLLCPYPREHLQIKFYFGPREQHFTQIDTGPYLSAAWIAQASDSESG